MGLDNFWRSEEDSGKQVEVEFPREPHLCGGLCSDHGCGSFRGKVYVDVIEEITGISLYEDKIPNKTVKEMADKLEEYFLDSENEEMKDLVMVFRVYADAGAALYSWW